MKPIYIHSGMVGAPQYANVDGNINGILEACLINGFNTRTATSASASGGVLTLNFGSDPGFEALQTVEVAVSSVALVNGQHRVVANSNNQVTIAIPGLPDGAVGSSGAGITIKQAGGGWSKPFSDATVSVFRPPAGLRRFLRCVHAVGTSMTANGYEDMTAISTGTGAFPSTSSTALYNNEYGHQSGLPWFAIVSDKWFVFSIGNAPTPNYSAGTLFFGDISEPVVPGDNFATVIHLLNNWYCARSFSGSAGAISAICRDSDGANSTYPSVVNEGLRFIPYCPFMEASDNVLRGVVPNLYKTYPWAPSANFSAVITNVSGASGRMKPVSFLVSNPALSAFSLDEEAWV